MARTIKKPAARQEEMTIDELAHMINSAFIKQDEQFVQHLEQKLEETLDERGYITQKDLDKTLDERGYITQKDLDKTLDERGYATSHDLQDAIIDVKDEIIAHIDRAVTPKLGNHERRISHLEQNV